jgi:Ala-tRNA(Pro) deacylase
MSEIVFKKIVDLLSSKDIKYDLIEHKPVFTSEEAARIRHTNIKQGAKALIFKADGKPVMIVIPGDKKVDTSRFKKNFIIKDLKFASPDEVEKYLDGVKIGAVHPLGNIHSIKVYIDRGLSRNKEIVFNAGLHDKSIIMKFSDYYKIVKPVLSAFTK